MSVANLTPQQHQVLNRIIAGDTVQAAADAVGVHRNTVLNWRRANPDFQTAWASIHYEQAMLWREQVLPLAPLAIDAIREILTNPSTTPSVRLRAALMIHKIASTPPPIQPEQHKRPVVVDFSALHNLTVETACAPSALRATTPVVQPETMHNDAQSKPAARPAPAVAAEPAVLQPKTVHNDAQSLAAAAPPAPARRPTTAEKLEKWARVIHAENAVKPCPCNSGKLNGQCCQIRTNNRQAA